MLAKDKFLTRLSEIDLNECPSCKSKLLFNKEKTYLACENQYDPHKKFETNRNGFCTRMITSLQILNECSEHYGVEIPEELKIA